MCSWTRWLAVFHSSFTLCCLSLRSHKTSSRFEWKAWRSLGADMDCGARVHKRAVLGGRNQLIRIQNTATGFNQNNRTNLSRECETGILSLKKMWEVEKNPTCPDILSWILVSRFPVTGQSSLDKEEQLDHCLGLVRPLNNFYLETKFKLNTGLQCLKIIGITKFAISS